MCIKTSLSKMNYNQMGWLRVACPEFMEFSIIIIDLTKMCRICNNHCCWQPEIIPKRARIGSAKTKDVHRIGSKGETMDIQTDLKQLSEDYLRIEQAILYLENHYKDQPSLEELAANIGLSEYHFQRLFTRWAGDRKSTRLNSSHLVI